MRKGEIGRGKKPDIFDVPLLQGEPEEPFEGLLEGKEKEEGGDEKVFPLNLQGLPYAIDPRREQQCARCETR